MLLFKKKNLIRFGFNLSIKSLTKYKFLNKLIISTKAFYSILNLKLLTYKILNFYSFLQIYKKNLKFNRRLIFVDGSSQELDRKSNENFLLNYNYYY